MFKARGIRSRPSWQFDYLPPKLIYKPISTCTSQPQRKAYPSPSRIHTLITTLLTRTLIAVDDPAPTDDPGPLKRHASLASAAKALTFTKSHSHTHSDPAPESIPHEIDKITTLSEFEQLLTDHHHRRVIIFCLTTTYKDPDVDEEGWYHHYEKLNNVHFVRVDLDISEDGLEERLSPKVRPCWVSFHKGLQTGWSSGGMKRFLQMHSERKGSQ